MSGILSVGGAGAVGVSGFYPVQINDSLRFEDGSSAYLNRTPSSAGNRQTWTWSGWVKRGKVGSGTQNYLFGATTDNYNVNWTIAGFFGDQFTLYSYTSSQNYQIQTNRVFRDPSAWYHIVIAFDTTATTSSDRIKLYINGVQETSLSTAAYPSQNLNDYINNSIQQDIGRAASSSFGMDGYLSNIHFIDGQALDPTSFGEAKDGTWIPKSYSGSYGTNGFHLEFNSNTNDTSGNGNNWTANNISAHDYVPDSPTNNFATMNSVEASSGVSATLSEGNLKTVGTTVSYSGGIASTFEQSSGKWYWEVYVNSEVSAGSNYYNFIGAATGDNNLIHKSNNSQIPTVASGVNGWSWEGDGTINLSGTGTKAVSSVTAPSAGSVLGFAIDLDNGNVYFYHNGTAQNSGNAVITGVTGLVHNPMVGVYNGSTVTFNFGQDSTFAGNTTAGGNTDANGIGDFKHSVPSGFLALASANLPEPTIIDGSEYFNTVLYSGNGGTQSITGVGFSPSWVWLKGRNFLSNHRLNDVVRGASASLKSNATSEEDTTSTYYVTSFDSDGFSLNSGNGDVNQSGGTFASWNWKAGTAFSNSAGSNGATIASSGSVNTDAGFSIVSYTGTGANATVGHGLSATPKMIIVKVRSTTNNWAVYHSAVGNTKALLLDSSGAELTSSLFWNNTSPTSSVFSISTGNSVNSSGQTYIAYCFADVEGYTKVGSYIGGGSNFPFVYTGFRPSWIMFKGATVSSHWSMFDATRHPSNVNDLRLFANLTNGDDSAYALDLLSNGFKLRHTGSDFNASGQTFIYLAFAESPQKYSNAR